VPEPTLRDRIAGIVYAHMASAADQPGTTEARIVNEVTAAVEAEHGEHLCVPYTAYLKLCGEYTEAEAECGAAQTRVKELEAALIGCGKPAAEDGPPLSLPDWAEREKQAPAATRADQYEADRDRAQAALQAEVDRVFAPGCLANVTNTVDVLAPVVADLIRQAREEGRREGMAELVSHLDDVAAGARAGKPFAYTEEADFWGPTRWCLITDQAHKLTEAYTAGKGLPVPDATARAQALGEELRREQGRHATEVIRYQGTVRRLNRRAQAAESALARVRREAESWGLPGHLTIPPHSPLRIAKAVGVSVGQAAVRVRSLGEENQRLRRQLDLAMRFEVGPVVVAPHPLGEGWRCSWPAPGWPGRPGQGPTLTEDHPGREAALDAAAQHAAQSLADTANARV
jgi:hypothetical protein